MAFWLLWGFDALIAAVVLYFFFAGLADGSVSSFNAGQSVAAVLPGHVSYGGAQGTGAQWWLPADRPAASLHADWLPERYERSGVESRRGAVTWGHAAIAPFPLPAHRTGRADFPHPALRPASSQGPRRRSHGLLGTQTEDSKLAEHDVSGEPCGPARRDLVTLDQEVLHARHDMVVDGAISRRAGAKVEVARPAFQQAVELGANLVPGLIVAPLQDRAQARLETCHAVLRRTGAEIPPAGARGVVRSEAVAEKVEAFLAGIAQGGLRLVEA